MVTERNVEAEILRLCHQGLDSHSLRRETIRLLRKVVPVDAFWFATADPGTLLFTSSVVEGIPEPATALFVTNEFQQDDVAKWVDLARAPRPVETLFGATGNAPTESQRYRDILAPLGLGDELRVVLRDGGTCWGFMCLHREGVETAFREHDAELLHRLSSHLAEGIRTGLLLGGAGVTAASEAPGLVLLDEKLSVVSVTAAAEHWLAEIGDWPQRYELPQVVYGVAARLQALERAVENAEDLMPRARLRTRSGGWLVLHASRLKAQSAPGEIAVILEPAQPGEVAPLAFLAYELTQREAEVGGLVMRGFSTGEIAAALFISPYTVQQHLKSVFEKTGVRSRRDFVARILAEQYLPRVRNNAAIGADGWFA